MEKKLAGELRIGFNNESQRREFERGVRQRNNYFNSYRTEHQTFFEKLFGSRSSKKSR